MPIALASFDDGGAARVVPADGHREAERQDEADEREQRPWTTPNGSRSVSLRWLERPAGQQSDDRRAEHDARQHDANSQLDSVKNNRLLPTWPRAAAYPERAATLCHGLTNLARSLDDGPMIEARRRSARRGGSGITGSGSSISCGRSPSGRPGRPRVALDACGVREARTAAVCR